MIRTAERPRFRLQACGRCGGDAMIDALDGDWRCLQCARPVTVDGRPNDDREPTHSGAEHSMPSRVAHASGYAPNKRV